MIYNYLLPRARSATARTLKCTTKKKVCTFEMHTLKSVRLALLNCTLLLAFSSAPYKTKMQQKAELQSANLAFLWLN